jgi:hypothetical protein
MENFLDKGKVLRMALSESLKIQNSVCSSLLLLISLSSASRG